jgi:hypothetical protein
MQERTHTETLPGKPLCGHPKATGFDERPTCGNCRRLLKREGRP